MRALWSRRLHALCGSEWYMRGANINLCPPGGVKTLKALGELINQDPTPYLAEMEQKAKPNMIAVIREAECIGCTKCIQACPVDAIIGGAKTDAYCHY